MRKDDPISFFDIVPMSLGGLVFVVILLLGISYVYFYKKRDLATTQPSDFSTIFHNIISAFAIIVGGLWVLISFNLLQQVETANRNLDLKEQEITEKQLSIDNTEASIISIDHKIIDYQSPNLEGTQGLIIEVKIKNSGKSRLIFNLDEYPLTVYNIEAKDHMIMKKKEIKPIVYSSIGSKGDGEKSRPLSKFISLKSSERVLSYFVTVEKNELYYITFKSQLDSADSAQKICGQEECNWFVSKYIYIN